MTTQKWYALLAVADLATLFALIWFRVLPDWLGVVFTVGLSIACLQFMWPELGPMFREIFFNE